MRNTVEKYIQEIQIPNKWGGDLSQKLANISNTIRHFQLDKSHMSPGDPVVEDGDKNEEVEENSDDGEETCKDGDKEGVAPAEEENMGFSH